MAHLQARGTLQLLVENTLQVLTAHGYEIVTADKGMFPRSTPPLAALKGGRLLVFAFSVFPSTGEPQSEMESLRVGLEASVDENAPGSDPRVGHVEKVAVVMAPEGGADLLPGGDIHWIVADNLETLSEQLHGELAL